MNPGEHLVIVGGGPAGLATARAYRQMGGEARVTILSSEVYAPYNRPPLTKEYLRGEASREDLPIEDEAWYGQNDVDLRLATTVAKLNRESQIVELDVDPLVRGLPDRGGHAPSVRRLPVEHGHPRLARADQAAPLETGR